MQQAAQIAFDAQTLYASLTGEVPSDKAAASADVEAIRKKLNNGLTTSESLKAVLRSHGVPHPLNGEDDDLVTVFLLDMEGTFVPAPFSRSVMLPQIASHMEAFVASRYPGEVAATRYLKPAVARSEELKKAFEEDSAHGHSIPEESALVRRLLLEHMKAAADSRSAMPYVKQFLGDVWADYVERHGDAVQSRVFSDFVDFVKDRGARSAMNSSRVFVYSTGSVELQETVLKRTQVGDLRPFVAGLIDPAMVGSKIMPKSYSKIRSHVSAVTGMSKDQFRIVFCTDNPSEASAAETSGSVESSVLIVRPGNDWVTCDSYTAVATPHIFTFAQLTSDSPTVDFDALAAEVNDYVKSISES